MTQPSLTSTKTAPKPIKRKIFTDTPKMASSKGDKKPVTKEMIQQIVSKKKPQPEKFANIRRKTPQRPGLVKPVTELKSRLSTPIRQQKKDE